VDAKRFFDYYSPEWKDRDGKPVKNWKQKMVGVWEPKADKPKDTPPKPLKYTREV
jgi:hypothetical protein